LYPNAYIIMIVIGTLKGNGAGFTKLFERLIRGFWTPTAMEFLQPTFYTKASVVASVIFVLDKKTDLISAPHSLVYFGIVIFLVYFKVSCTFLTPMWCKPLAHLLLPSTVVVDFVGNSRSICAIREFAVRPLLRRHLGQLGQDFGPWPGQGGVKGREENKLISHLQFFISFF
jgi:TRIC channel